MISEITSSYLPTEVEIRARGRVHAFRVHPPSAGQAIAIIEASRRLDEQDERQDAVEAIYRIVAQWLPIRLSSLVMSQGFPPARAMRLIMDLLVAGAPDAKKANRTREEAEDRARRSGWTEVVAEYMHVYSQALPEVLATPFPAFLALLDRIERIRASRMLRELHVQSIPNMRDARQQKQTIGRIMAAAGVRPAGLKVPIGQEPDWVKDPKKRHEWKQRQREELQRVMAIWNKKGAEA